MQTKTPIIGTGLSGLVGSKFVDLYQDKYEIVNLDLHDPTNPVDITNAQQVMQAVKSSPAKFIIHMAAYTNVTDAWEQRGDKSGLAWQVNVVGTQNIANACQATGKHLIHISTAYVFDGQKPTPYVEADPANPIEWYGQTKYEAEKIIQALNTPWTILRIDQPFRSDEAVRPDVVRRIIAKLKDDTLPPQFIDHTMGPTFIDDFARVIDFVIRKELTGIYHATSGESWTDYEFALEIAKKLGLENKVRQGSLTEYLKTTSRPYQRNTALSVDKLKKELDFKLTSIKAVINQIQF